LENISGRFHCDTYLYNNICRLERANQARFIRSHVAATMEGIIGLASDTLGFYIRIGDCHPSIAAFGLSRLSHRGLPGVRETGWIE
jgi:hypothetical protein